MQEVKKTPQLQAYSFKRSASNLQLQAMQDFQYFSFQESFKNLIEEDHARSEEDPQL